MPGCAIVNGSDVRGAAPTSWWSPRHDELRLRRARGAVQAVLRGADAPGRRPRRDLPDARRPVAGHGRRGGGGRVRHRRAGAATVGKPDAAALPHRAGPPRPGPRARRRRPPGRRPGAAPRRAGLDAAVVLTGATTRAGRGRAPRARARRHRRLARPSSSWPAAGMTARSRLHRQPVRRRRPRAAARCPRWRRRSARRGIASGPSQRTSALTHGRELARERRATPARWSSAMRRATAWSARSPARCARPGGVLGRAARRPRQRLRARRSGIPRDPVAAVRACSPTGAPRAVDVGEVGRARRSSGSRARLRLRRQPDRQRARPRRWARSSTLRRAARAGALEARRASTSTLDGEPRAVRRLDVGAPPTPRPTAAGCSWRPTPSSTTAQLDVVLTARTARSGASLRELPKVFKGTHVDHAEVDVLRGPRGRIAADRPFAVYADGDPIGRAARHDARRCPARCSVLLPRMTLLGAKVAAARAAGRAGARAPAAAAARALPGQGPDARSSRGRSAELAGRLEHGSAVISATNGKTTTAAMVAADPRRSRRARSCTTGRAPTWRAAWPARCWTPRAAAGASTATSGSSRSTSSGSSRSWPSSQPRALLLGQPVPRPARPLRRARDDRRPLGRASSPPRPRRAGAQRRRPPGRRPRARTARTTVYFGVEDDALALPELQHAADSKHCRRCGHAYVYDAVYLGPPRPLPLPQLRPAARPTPRGGARRASARRHPRPPRFDAAHARGPRRRRAAAPGPLQRLQRAGRGRRWPWRSARRWTRSSAGLEASPPPSGARRPSRVGGRPLSILLVKNPAGANEVLRTLTLEDGELDLLGVLNDNTADGRDVSWVWDADFELLVGPLRRVTCAGTRAAELALRLKYAGVPEERVAVVEDLARGAGRGARRRRAGRCTRFPPTRRCWSCASCWPAAGQRGGATGDEPGGRLARPRVRRLLRGPAAVARAGGARRRAGARRRRRHGPGRARPRPPRATTWPRSTSTRRCWRRCASAAPASCRVSTVVADAADVRARAPLRADTRADADGPAPRRGSRRGRSCARARAHLAPGRAPRGGARRGRWRRSSPRTRLPAARPAGDRRRRVRQPAGGRPRAGAAAA